MARALATALVVSLLAVSGASGSPAQTPKNGGTVVFGPTVPEPKCLNPLIPTTCSTGVLPGLILEKVLMPAFTVAPDFI